MVRPPIYVISGPMAAGKTTVARLLADRFDRAVHLEGDWFRRSIVSGRCDMTPADEPEALRQLELRYRLTALAADAYADAGFAVVIDDVIGPGRLGSYRTAIRSRPCHVVVLLPSRDAIAEREAARAAKGYGAWDVDELYDAFAAGPRVGLWLDTTEQSPEQTVAAVLAAAAAPPEPVVVVDYDPRWPEVFAELAAPLRAAVADLGGEVEHVGSTSVAGLAAKPIIDIDVVVPSADVVPAAIERICAIGYVYQGDKGVPGREAFQAPAEAPLHHVYVVVGGNAAHRNHIRFRDHLRTHPDAASEYAELKRALARRHPDDVIAYTEGKSDFVGGVLGTSPT